MLDRVLDRAPEDRAAFLDKACADEAVRAEVEALLAEMDTAEASGFMKAPVFAAAQEEEGMGSDPFRLVGTTMRHFDVIEYLGGGGMGAVYKARDVRLGRTVALKLLLPHLSIDEGAQQRFRTEARAASALVHPNICTIYDIGETEAGQTFIAMACYEGETLKAKIDRGPLPIEEACDLAIQVAKGLARAHRVGIVHRDVKPGNVMVTPRGRVKVLDFGIATMHRTAEATGGEPAPRRGKEETGRNASGRGAELEAGVGTIAYMSPEQVRGEPASAQSDLWALGVVLYEMLTGTRLFEGPDESSIGEAVLDREAKPVRALRAEVPDELAQIVDDLLQKHPDQRYQTASEVAADLEAVRASEADVELWWKGGAVWAALTVLVIVIAVWMGLGELRDQPVSEELAVKKLAPNPRSIAVLPFAYVGAPDSTDYFSLGMTDEVLTALSTVHGLSVIARTSVMPYQATEKSVPEIGQELNVAHVLEGSVQREGEKVRIRVRLLDAETGEHLWAESYTRPFKEILLLQSDVAQATTRQITAELAPQRSSTYDLTTTIDPIAYQLYLRAQSARYEMSASGMKRAINLFERSIGKDSTFAPAWSGLGIALLWDWMFSGSPLAVNQERHLRATARQAIALDSQLPEAYLLSALIAQLRDWEFESGLRQLERAISLDPNHSEAHREMGYLMLRIGCPADALHHMQRAFTLDPVAVHSLQSIAVGYFHLGQYEQALRTIDRALQIEPSYSLGYQYAVTSAVQLGRYNRARQYLQRRRQMVPDADRFLKFEWLYLYSALGRSDTLRMMLNHELGPGSGWYAGHHFLRAVAYMGLKEHEAAIDELRLAAQAREVGFIALKVRSEPIFDPIRTDSEFQGILKSAGLVVKER